VLRSDPYIVLTIGDRVLCHTDYHPNTLNPVWNQSFEIPLLHLKNKLTLLVYDHDSGDDDLLGKVDVNLNSLKGKPESQITAPIEKGEGTDIEPRGTITFNIYVEVSLSQHISNNNVN
jgi:Ca2+-dependent lipid-binding protein